METYSLVVLLLLVLLPFGIARLLFDMGGTTTHYRCDHPDCHQEFPDEQAALGHQADHARHKTKRVD